MVAYALDTVLLAMAELHVAAGNARERKKKRWCDELLLYRFCQSQHAQRHMHMHGTRRGRAWCLRLRALRVWASTCRSDAWLWSTRRSEVKHS